MLFIDDKIHNKIKKFIINELSKNFKCNEIWYCRDTFSFSALEITENLKKVYITEGNINQYITLGYIDRSETIIENYLENLKNMGYECIALC